MKTTGTNQDMRMARRCKIVFEINKQWNPIEMDGGEKFTNYPLKNHSGIFIHSICFTPIRTVWFDGVLLCFVCIFSSKKLLLMSSVRVVFRCSGFMKIQIDIKIKLPRYGFSTKATEKNLVLTAICGRFKQIPIGKKNPSKRRQWSWDKEKDPKLFNSDSDSNITIKHIYLRFIDSQRMTRRVNGIIRLMQMELIILVTTTFNGLDCLSHVNAVVFNVYESNREFLLIRLLHVFFVGRQKSNDVKKNCFSFELPIK